MNNLSEEEKNAIEELRLTIRYINNKGSMFCDNEDKDNIQICLNLIDKQQKEIEEYKKKLTPTPDNCVPIEYQMIGYVDKRGYISKDKIREKIKELKSIGKYKLDHKDLYLEQESIDILQELLEGE